MMKGKYQFLYHPLEISEFSFENRVFYEYDSKTEKNLTDIVDQKMNDIIAEGKADILYV